MNRIHTLQKAQKSSIDGNFQEVETLLRSFLQSDPDNPEALFLLGTAQSELGKYKEAVNTLQKAASLKPGDGPLLNNLGNAYLALSINENALESFDKAIAINPNNDTYHANKGVSLFKMHRYQEALDSFEIAITQNPEAIDSHLKSAICLMRCGEFERSINKLLQLNEHEPDNPEIYIQLISCLLYMHATDDALKVIELGLQNTQKNNDAQFSLLTSKTMVHWITGDIASAHEAMKSSRELTIPGHDTKDARSIIAYNNYLGQLLQERTTHQHLYQHVADKPLFFIAESHCLTPSELPVIIGENYHRILSSVIIGAKMYHLGQPEMNCYSRSTEIIFNALPDNSMVVSGFGEIDCRFDEGILKAHKNFGIRYTDSVPALVKRYQEKIISYSRPKNLQVLFYGVPTPSDEALSKASEQDGTLLREIVRLVNECLRRNCELMNLPFLDIYQMTVSSDLSGRSDFFLERHHIHPKHIPKLFESFLIFKK
ncbi:MAG: tetratricopeptide repeat protein [Desulfobulbaceae bacterium]|nr:MAG: tetratricopeptide repeat protein [Desulfobulbaceae bacterium]